MKKKDFENKVFTTNSSRETQKLGQSFAKVLEKGDTVALYGDLGSGKTTFVQGLAEGLGVKEKIISPTFIIIRSYPSKNFYHIDLYRIEKNQKIESLGLAEILDNPLNIVAIEWAERIENLLPKKIIKIKFSHEDNNVRKIFFSLGL